MTNDKAATPEIILWAHRLRNECLGRKPTELFDITAKRAVEVANQFDAMQFKIEALQSEITGLRGLCGEAIEHIMRGRNHGIIRGRLHRASKGTV